MGQKTVTRFLHQCLRMHNLNSGWCWRLQRACSACKLHILDVKATLFDTSHQSLLSVFSKRCSVRHFNHVLAGGGRDNNT